MPTNVKELLAAANQSVPKLAPTEAAAKMRDGNVLVLDRWLVRHGPSFIALPVGR